LGSRSAVADSKQTLLCTYPSAVLLVGLALNSLFGWSWADPIAALVIAAVAIKEGREAWGGDSCCAPALVTSIDTVISGVAADAQQAPGPGCDCCAPIDRCAGGTGSVVGDSVAGRADLGFRPGSG